MSSACLTYPYKNPFVALIEYGVSDDADRIHSTVMNVQNEYINTVSTFDRLNPIFDMIIDLIAECLTDNWDGYGAKALQTHSYIGALKFLYLLPTTTPHPDISVDPDGELVFEWYKAPRKVFSVSIGTNSELVYAGLYGLNKVNGTELFTDEIPNTILENITRVYS